MAFAGFGRCCIVGIVLLAFLGFGAYQASTLSDNNVFRTWQSNVTNFVYGAWNASAAAAAAAASAPLLFKTRSDQNPQVFCPRISFPLLCVSRRRSKSAGSLSGISFPLLCVSCRRSKSAGSLSGISFPTICVVVVLAVISVYVVDNWMMIVSSSLLILNARRTGTIVFRL
jgi:hypothetical protein